MCEFCENMEENVVNMDLIDENNNFVLLLEEGEPVVGVVAPDDYMNIGTWTSTKINYCPICGRDLRSEENERIRTGN